ncbi:blocked early in transport 1 [Entomortierella parvispora]|uniref:Blocked early in transport 1 n=1 Tax=Entomortierella parvispora TaxID=205924 RepID=A0A9P3HD37_9FUNG|nr:blocked early in transport 1 [Entomortierella parvispora]
MSFMNSRQRQQNAWQRNQLLPTHTNSGRSSPYDPSKMTDRDLLSLESQNDEELSGLHSKVAMLKKITMDIGHEVRDSTSFLGDLDQDFGRTGGLLNSTYTRLKVMASTQNGRYMCYMIMFCVFALIFAYFFIYRR